MCRSKARRRKKLHMPRRLFRRGMCPRLATNGRGDGRRHVDIDQRLTPFSRDLIRRFYYLSGLKTTYLHSVVLARDGAQVLMILTSDVWPEIVGSSALVELGSPMK